MAAYIVSVITVLDPENFARFRASSPRPSAGFGGEEVVRGRVLELLEGQGNAADETVAVMRFPDALSARALIASPEFQAMKRQREGLVDVTMRLVAAGE